MADAPLCKLCGKKIEGESTQCRTCGQTVCRRCCYVCYCSQMRCLACFHQCVPCMGCSIVYYRACARCLEPNGAERECRRCNCKVCSRCWDNKDRCCTGCIPPPPSYEKYHLHPRVEKPRRRGRRGGRRTHHRDSSYSSTIIWDTSRSHHSVNKEKK